MVITSVGVPFTDWFGCRRVPDLAGLGRDAIGEDSLVQVGADGLGAELLEPACVPAAIDTVQAYGLDHPERLLDTTTPYYTQNIVVLNEAPPRWDCSRSARTDTFARRDRAHDDPRH